MRFSNPEALVSEFSREETGPIGRSNQTNAQIDPRLLEILVCPLTKGALEYDPIRQELISRRAKLAYPIRDGIPIMIAEEARPLEDNI